MKKISSYLIFAAWLSSLSSYGFAQGDGTIFKQLATGTDEEIASLIVQGAKPDATGHDWRVRPIYTNYTMTNFSAAVYYNRLPAVKLFLQQGADPNIKSMYYGILKNALSDLMTPSFEMLEVLLQGGVNPYQMEFIRWNQGGSRQVIVHRSLLTELLEDYGTTFDPIIVALIKSWDISKDLGLGHGAYSQYPQSWSSYLYFYRHSRFRDPIATANSEVVQELISHGAQ